MRREIVTLVLLLGCTGMLAAQVPDSAAVAHATPAALGVRPGRTARVAVPGEGRIAGTVTASDPDGFTLATPGGERRFPTLPDTLWTRERAVVPGMVVGGIVGAGAGVFLGLIANALCEYDCNDSPVGDAALGALVVGAGGAALGALVGAAVPRWKRRAP
jgi:hypothetical protein